MNSDINTFNNSQTPQFKEICDLLGTIISQELTDSKSKIWHSHPVWFLNENPIAGYSIQKKGVRLMFWSGADFDEPALQIGTGKFKDASVFYNSASEISVPDLKRWLNKSKSIQWDYKNIVKRKGKLERI